MAQSETIGKLVTALIAARKEMSHPQRKHKGQARGGTYMYADLADSIDATTALWEHGLAIVQAGDVIDGLPFLRTTLMHESGEWISGVLELPAGAKSQDLGSAITYARRYARAAILDLAAEDDDDGAGAQGAPQQSAQPRSKPAAKDASKTADEAIIAVAKALFEDRADLFAGENEAEKKRSALRHVTSTHGTMHSAPIDRLNPQEMDALYAEALARLKVIAAEREG